MVESVQAFKSSSGRVYLKKEDALKEELEAMLVKSQAINQAGATKLLEAFVEDRKMAIDFGNMLSDYLNKMPQVEPATVESVASYGDE